nr:barstar family protein [Streptomyces sp. MZ04]
MNGPGGYFGWNLDAVDDCLRGRWGASPPFTLEWQHSDVARSHLVHHHAVEGDTGTLFELLLRIFEGRGIEVLLR